MASILIGGVHGWMGMLYFVKMFLLIRFRAAPESIIAVNSRENVSVLRVIGKVNYLLLSNENFSVFTQGAAWDLCGHPRLRWPASPQ